MKVQELIGWIPARAAGGEGEDREIRGGFLSDVMSRAMAEGFSGMAWITHRADMNALAVAVMKDAACLIFPAGTEPEETVVLQAQKEKMPLFMANETAFMLAGRLYEAGLRGGEEEKNDAQS